MPDHLFWFLLTIACVFWYSAITWYVAFRGARDIKELLAHLRDKHAEQTGAALKQELLSNTSTKQRETTEH